MDLLNRLLGHDSWTTQRLIMICAELHDKQLDQEFDIGHRTIRRTLDHVVWNIECWSDLLRGIAVRSRDHDDSIQSLIQRFEAATANFQAVAHQIANDGRFNECFIDVLDDPPGKKSFGGTILHIVTHGMHHRAHLKFMLRKHGVDNIPEGDVLTWEQAMRETDDSFHRLDSSRS